ncbi:36455_t:CDS:1, partial [Gigaspora margarita]
SELNHLRNTIIKELQKKLKNHYRAIGEQVFSMHCSENAFVGIFGSYITHYSPCGSFYLCNFRRENAVETIGLMFKNNQWYKCDYGDGQCSFVRFYSPENKILETNNKLQRQKKKLSPNGE